MVVLSMGGRCQLGPGFLGCHATAAVLCECVVHEQVDDLEDGQHAGTEQQTDVAAQLT